MRDCEGMARWRVRVPKGERTCLLCGETTAEAYCPRCGLDDRGELLSGGQLVETLSYLHEDEWEGV